MLCHIMGKDELNLLSGVSENRTGSHRVKGTEVDITFLELLHNETGCCVKLCYLSK